MSKRIKDGMAGLGLHIGRETKRLELMGSPDRDGRCARYGCLPAAPRSVCGPVDRQTGPEVASVDCQLGRGSLAARHNTSHGNFWWSLAPHGVNGEGVAEAGQGRAHGSPRSQPNIGYISP